MIARRRCSIDPIVRETTTGFRPARRSDAKCDFHLYGSIRASIAANNRQRVSLRFVYNVYFSVSPSRSPPAGAPVRSECAAAYHEHRTFVPDVPKKNLNRNNISSQAPFINIKPYDFRSHYNYTTSISYFRSKITFLIKQQDISMLVYIIFTRVLNA